MLKLSLMSGRVPNLASRILVSLISLSMTLSFCYVVINVTVTIVIQNGVKKYCLSSLPGPHQVKHCSQSKKDDSRYTSVYNLLFLFIESVPGFFCRRHSYLENVTMEPGRSLGFCEDLSLFDAP